MSTTPTLRLRIMKHSDSEEDYDLPPPPPMDELEEEASSRSSEGIADRRATRSESPTRQRLSIEAKELRRMLEDERERRVEEVTELKVQLRLLQRELDDVRLQLRQAQDAKSRSSSKSESEAGGVTTTQPDCDEQVSHPHRDSAGSKSESGVAKGRASSTSSSMSTSSGLASPRASRFANRSLSVWSQASQDLGTGATTARSSQQEAAELLSLQSKLPVLRGWLEKKSPRKLGGWQRRWVVLTESNLFYGKNEVPIQSAQDGVDAAMNCISFMVVQSIRPCSVNSKDRDLIFEIVAQDKRGELRMYMFRTRSPQEREKWVDGLRKHHEFLQSLLACDGISFEAVA